MLYFSPYNKNINSYYYYIKLDCVIAPTHSLTIEDTKFMSYKKALLSIPLLLLMSACNNNNNNDDTSTESNSVLSSLPSNLAEGVKSNSQIFIFFDKKVSDNVNSENTQLKEYDSNKVIAGGIDIRGNTLIFSPTKSLNDGTKYQFTSLDNVTIDFTTTALEAPALTHTPADSTAEFNIAPSGEVYTPITDPDRIAEHAKFHPYKPLVTATLPGLFTPPAMDKLSDFANLKKNLTIINPGQVSDPIHDEFLWVMEGKRHGFEELTIVQTNTPPGNGGPLHTHFGEESHVLMEGTIRYHLKVGDLEQEFTMEAPYVINIPSMAPHAFMNVGNKPAKIVGIFPASNKWEYDVLEAAVFPEESKEGTQQRRSANTFDSPVAWLKYWHSPEARERRLRAYNTMEENKGN